MRFLAAHCVWMHGSFTRTDPFQLMKESATKNIRVASSLRFASLGENYLEVRRAFWSHPEWVIRPGREADSQCAQHPLAFPLPGKIRPNRLRLLTRIRLPAAYERVNEHLKVAGKRRRRHQQTSRSLRLG